MTVAPEYRRLVRAVPWRDVTPRNLPLIRRLTWVGRLLVRPASGATISDAHTDGARVRVYRPESAAQPAAVLWIHGGGLIMGRPDLDDGRASRLAAALGITVVSATYRLAPEHPFPAALDDCEAAWTWLQTHASTLGVDPTRVVIAGGSAGGGLAAALVQRLHDSGAVQPVGQLLLYPMLDDRTAADASLDALSHPVWTNASNRTGWSAYLGQPPGRSDVPTHAVPARRRDLSGLPPAWIGVGTADLFLAENRAYARRLADAGVPVQLVEVEDAPHGFDVVTAPRQSQDLWLSQVDFLTGCLDLDAAAETAAGLPGPDWIDQAPITVEESVRIEASPSRVWEQVADHAAWPEWFPGLASVEVTGRASGVGGRRRVVAGPVRFDEVFTVWQPEAHLAFAVTSTTVPGIASLAESVRLQGADRGTLVIYRQGVEGHPGVDRVLARAWQRGAGSLLAQGLAALKERSEGLARRPVPTA